MKFFKNYRARDYSKKVCLAFRGIELSHPEIKKFQLVTFWPKD